MRACLNFRMCATYMPGMHGGQKRVSSSLELELQSIVNYLMQILGPLQKQQVLQFHDAKFER